MSKAQVLAEAKRSRSLNITAADLLMTLAASKEAILAPYKAAEALLAAGKTPCAWCGSAEAQGAHDGHCSDDCNARSYRAEEAFWDRQR